MPPTVPFTIALSPPPAMSALPASRCADVRLALRLTYLTLAWMTVEGVSSVALGVISRSLLLVAFGIDSGIELFSASVLWWRLRVEAGGRADAERIERVERRASKLAGYALFALAIYVVATSAYGMLAHHASDPRESVWGVLIGVVAAVGMPILAKLKLRVAAPDRLNSKALRADAMEALTCGYLSLVLIAGLIVTRVLGWWWLDNVAALALVPLLIKEGREAVKGEGCSCGGACGGYVSTGLNKQD
jgi:divalent metal cation (Fe/Co/Zn/Cd) transporter